MAFGKNNTMIFSGIWYKIEEIYIYKTIEFQCSENKIGYFLNVCNLYY